MNNGVPASLDVQRVDPRLDRAVLTAPVFRVDIFGAVDTEAITPSAEEYEVTGGSVDDVVAWADEATPRGGSATVHLVVPGTLTHDGHPLLVWLAGADPTAQDSEH